MKNKRTSKEIFAELERVANVLPAPIYWLDNKGIVLGANDLSFKMVGGEYTRKMIIGKKHSSFYPKDIADKLTLNNEEVMVLGKTIEFEEQVVNLSNGEVRFLMSIRSPLRDDDDNIIGVIGTSIDISDKKERERLEKENEKHQAEALKQASIKEVASQLVHDIKSPLTSLQNIIHMTNRLPESEKIILRSISSSIMKIANNLLNKYLDKDDFSDKVKQETLVSFILEEIVREKKYQFTNISSKLTLKIPAESEYLCIMLNSSAFKRMLSNLLNNAIEAINNLDNGEVLIELSYTDDVVSILVKDNGCGMSARVREDILKKNRVTANKVSGYGIGFRQIQDTVTLGNGKLEINSKVNEGTEIKVSFPRIATPAWLVNEIIVGTKDIIVVLDDDDSVHNIWDNRFKEILFHHHDIKLMHFRAPDMALKYINKLPKIDKEKLQIMSDYEFINQEDNGLDFIKKVNSLRSILVTNHYDNPEILGHNIDILPKYLVSEVKITLDRNRSYTKDLNATNRVDLIYLEPYRSYRVIKQLFFYKKIDHYIDYKELLEHIHKYPKNNKICLAYNLYDENMNGIDLAIKLHKMGYTKIAIFTSDWVNIESLPPYVKLIEQSFLDEFYQYLNVSSA